MRAYHETYGLDTSVTNCSNNYGPYQFPEKLIPLTIVNILLGKPLPVYGDGLQVRDWLHVEDHCMAIALASEAGEPGDVYNIGGDLRNNQCRDRATLCGWWTKSSASIPKLRETFRPSPAARMASERSN